MQVKCQTSPGWAKGLTDGMPKFIAENGIGGLYRGIVPLWGRQVCLVSLLRACVRRIRYPLDAYDGVLMCTLPVTCWFIARCCIPPCSQSDSFHVCADPLHHDEVRSVPPSSPLV